MHEQRGAVAILDDVATALAAGRPVVALESSVLAQGLPIPANREAAARMAAAVRAHGAVPAITAVVRGVPSLGLSDEALERFLSGGHLAKASARDLGFAMATATDGATTVAAAISIAHLGGVGVFATGGIGGVHRFPAYDESADLLELARTPIIVVSSGAKSILDLPATLERLETLGISVLGYRTNELPAFLSRESGLPLPNRVDSVRDVVALFRAERSLMRPGALLVMQPAPEAQALSRTEVETAVDRALTRTRLEGVTGAALTPSLLSALEAETDGRSLAANVALLEKNASLAAEIAVEMSNNVAA